MIIFILISSSLIASEKEHDEIISYSDFNVNESLSLYAGQTHMDYFLDDEAYSVGLIMQEDTHSDFEFGFGYIQPSSKFTQLSSTEIDPIKAADEDGVLFFINYNF